MYVFNKGYNDYVSFKRFCDNENAIQKQICYILIEDLLLTVVQKQLNALVFLKFRDFCQIQLFNYLYLTRFLENSEKDSFRDQQKLQQKNLFDWQGLLF